jgi:putative nucleotidyltransferase with HDIG domain
MSLPVSASTKVIHTLKRPDEANDSSSLGAIGISMSLRRWFDCEFTVLDVNSGAKLHEAAGQPKVDWQARLELCREISRTGQPAFIEEEGPLAALALPLADARDVQLVAVALFVTSQVQSKAGVESAAAALGLPVESLATWAMQQKPVAINTLERLAALTLSKLTADVRIEQLEQENEKLSAQIGSTFEEISLIYRLTQNLKISRNKEDLSRMALDWLTDVLPAQGFAIQFLPVAESERMPGEAPAEPTLLCHGKCPLRVEQFTAMLNELELDHVGPPLVVNRSQTGEANWPFPDVNELIVAPLAEGERLFGWLVAVNHQQHLEFGTVEASLLNSVATILAIHASNLDLYRQQAEVLADVVRAMSSAIDAKDPYTRGHSDRVARVAVRLAQELGCDSETLKTIYLSGLLHDIGKIGIDDNVLRKPGKLTEAEFEHVKTHVDIGYRILRGLRKMGHMLPVVLHHHESWDGTGYPFGLAGQNIPFLARVVAVADAYDAMASDRPYRAGMSDDKLDAVIRKGSGQQWDAEIVDAFFRARDDIREISSREVDHSDVATLQWS